jgi:hypothetical protein
MKGRDQEEDLDNIRMDLTEIVWKEVYWMHMAQGMDQRRVMKLRVP